MTMPTWVELLKLKSELFRKAEAIAKRNCSLPLRKSRGAFLMVHDQDGKQLVGSADVGFPKCGADWRAMVKIMKEKHPKAHTLHMNLVVDSSRGWRAYEAGDIKQCTGIATALVFTYGLDLL